MDWKDSDEMLKWGKTPDCLEKCCTCKKIKPLLEFRKPTTHKDKAYWQCKECAYEYARKTVLTRYGISVEEYNALLLHQNGKCAVCRTKNPSKNHRTSYFCIDHNHITGKIRGLLCYRCNLLIGFANDDPAILDRAAGYLEDPEYLTYD